MPGQCAALAAMRDLDDIYEHMGQFCIECIEARLEDAANGEELIFTDGPPSWIAEQQARDAEERAEKERQEGLRKKREAIERKKERMGEGKEKRVNWASAEEEKKAQIRKLAGELADRHLEFEIRKIMQVDPAEAAQMRLELKREVAAKRKEKEKAKEKEDIKQEFLQQKEEEQKKNPEAPKENMCKVYAQNRPWQPQIERAVAMKDPRRSALTLEEQKRYVAILSNFHRIDQSMRFMQNATDLKVYDERLSEERRIMAEVVKAYVKNVVVSMKEVNTEVDYVLARWRARYAPGDKRRYERMTQLPWKREAEKPPVQGVLKPILERVLAAAPSPKLVLPPQMHDRVHVNYTPYRFDHRGKVVEEIGKDTTLASLLAETGATVAMDCTTAVHLMARPSEPRNYAYTIPLNVHQQFRGGSLVRALLLGKPRPQSNVTNHTLLHMVAKYRAKSTFTKQEDPHSPRKPGQGKDAKGPKASTVEEKKKGEEGEKGGEVSFLDDLFGSEAPSKPDSSEDDTQAPGMCIVEEEEEEEGGEKGGKEGEGEKTKEGESGGGASLLDDLLGNLITPSSSTAKGTKAGATAKSATTHSYGLFSIPSYTEDETKVIIRSSPCARNDATGGTEYALAAKVEMVPEAGVMRETYEDMLWTSMKTLFKGAVNSATVHIHPFMKDALQITHSRAVPPSTHLNEPFFPLLSTRTEHLSRLLAELQTLESGEYLLHITPQSDEMTVYRESPRGNELFFNKVPRRINGTLKAADNFTGIDDKRVLHWQIMQGRAPLTFWPEGHQILKTAERRETKDATKRQPVKRKAEDQLWDEDPAPHLNRKQRRSLKGKGMEGEEGGGRGGRGGGRGGFGFGRGRGGRGGGFFGRGRGRGGRGGRGEHEGYRDMDQAD